MAGAFVIPGVTMAALSHRMDVYSAWIHLARTRAEWRVLKKSTGLPMSKINSAGLTEKFIDVKSGLVQFCIYVDTKHQDERDLLELCAHEAAHMSALMLDHVGTEYDGESESLAYLVGWATTWLWEGCRP